MSERQIQPYPDLSKPQLIDDYSNPYGLLLAEVHAIRAELDDLRERVAELEADLHETWMGGNE